ncbi:colicin immunity domain-containing protein [Sphingobacterium sp. GVS05A]|uniref:colicin immunity domain-containing protein n=1 Tax=Sphingobacterium sp. GVS05A TaxID=2862679 RepID=UPI001CBECD95|nr:colicin immunity domain-containing protein [Sphingobacterium sp. GVS05A]
MSTSLTQMEKIQLRKYLYLLRAFLNNEIAVLVFETSFLQLRREDIHWMASVSDNGIYRILDTLFLDVDEYAPDELYDERDQFNISESELKRRLGAHLVLLEELIS